MSNENVADGDVRRKGGLGQRIAYACGNLGQAAFYNAMSTYFVTYVTSCLFVSYSKALAAQMIAVITGLIVVIRILNSTLPFPSLLCNCLLFCGCAYPHGMGRKQNKIPHRASEQPRQRSQRSELTYHIP